MLDKDQLVLAIRNKADLFVDDAPEDVRLLRKAAYRNFILWKYFYLGRGNRRVIPSCCVWTIRDTYPSPDGTYLGYKDE